MRHYLKGLGAALLLMLPIAAHAAGTPANTAITNTATASYTVGAGVAQTATSNTVTVTVQQVTDVVVTPQNSPITVNPGDAGRIAIFRVTNTGNGPDTFTLAPNSTIAGDNFDPVLSAPNSIAIDANGNGVYDPGVDTYATTAGPIAADSYATIFVFNDIPVGVVDTYTGLTEVTATSQTASGAPGTVNPGGGVGGVNAIVGGNGGAGTAQATYVVSSATVNIVKSSAVILDPYSAGPPYQPIPGATVQYTLNVSVTGGATANNVVITDAIPANTTYVANSMTLNGTALTDAADVDAGTFTGTGISVSLGNMTSATAAQTITFNVTIN